MAQGDFKIFDEALPAMKDGTHDMDTDVFKVGIIDNTAAPTEADATPVWGDYSANEATTTANYVAGGPSVGACTLSEVSGTMTVDWTTDVAITGHASGDTTVYWGIYYNSTAAGSPAIGYIDLGGPVTMVQDLNITGPLWTETKA